MSWMFDEKYSWPKLKPFRGERLFKSIKFSGLGFLFSPFPLLFVSSLPSIPRLNSYSVKFSSDEDDEIIPKSIRFWVRGCFFLGGSVFLWSLGVSKSSKSTYPMGTKSWITYTRADLAILSQPLRLRFLSHSLSQIKDLTIVRSDIDFFLWRLNYLIFNSIFKTHQLSLVSVSII